MSVRLGWPALLAAAPASMNPSESAGIVFSMFDSFESDAARRCYWALATGKEATRSLFAIKVSPQFERFERIALKSEISRNLY
jgi:hypothetical protein